MLAYCRVSESSSVKTSLSPETQADRCVQYKHSILKDVQWSTEKYPESAPPGFFIDAGVSAWDKNRLASRPAGSKLVEAARPGDHILVWSVDRMFRNVGDFGTMIDHFRRQGIHVHFISDDIDLSTPSGQLKAALIAVLAEHFSRMLSFRVKEAAAIKRVRQGGAGNIHTPNKKPGKVSDLTKYVADEVPSKIFTPHGRQAKEKAVTGIRRVWGYVRVSSDGQVESGLGLQHQRDRVEGEISRLPEAEHLGIIADEAVSSFKVPFALRPGGKRILEEAKPGDCVVVYRGDRIFRSLKDMAETIGMFRKRGIVLKLIEEGIRTDDINSDWYLSLVVMFAEMESKIKSARNKECIARMKREGLCYTEPDRFVLYRGVMIDGKRRLVVNWNRAARYAAAFIIQYEFGFGITHTTKIINTILAQRKGVKPSLFISGGLRLKKNRNKKKHFNKYKPVNTGQMILLRKFWPEFIDSIGRFGAKRLDNIARQYLATSIEKDGLRFLELSGVSIERLRDYFILAGVDRRLPLSDTPNDGFSASVEDLEA